MTTRPLIVFDVNETLLDLRVMEPTFERIFGGKDTMRLWFANLILYSASLTLAGCYVPFTDIGSAVMKMLADTRGIKISDSDKKESSCFSLRAIPGTRSEPSPPDGERR
jgi:2-haloacid dehalogenase